MTDARAPAPTTARTGLIALWCLAAMARLAQLWLEPAYLHPDALFQGLEPAFRAVHGHGVVAWEFKEGLRSWTWPGLLALPFGLCHLLGLSGPGQGMALAVGGARALVVAIDLWALWEASRLARRRGGLVGEAALLALGAAHPAFVVMAAQPLIDVPAAALLLALTRRADAGEGRPAVFGALAAATALVRIQLAPAVLAPALWRVVATDERRAVVREAALGGLAVVALWAVVDQLTWGAPLSSLSAYLAYNLGEGQTSFGTMPPDRYWAHWGEAMPIGRWLLAGLALAGARRAPAVALALVAVALPHQLVPYKVWRFVHPALWLCATLAAVGATQLARADHRAARPLALACAALALAGIAWSWHDAGLWRTTWLHHQGGDVAVQRSRGLNRAWLAAGTLDRLPGVVQGVLPEAGAPGFALLGHEAEVVHPVGARRERGALARFDTFVLVEGPGKPAIPGADRLFHDPSSGVSLLRRPGRRPTRSPTRAPPPQRQVP